MDYDVPRSEAGLYAAIGWERTRLALRGMRFTPRAAGDVRTEQLTDGFTWGSLSIDTQAYDPLRAALFQARCLRLALDAGVPLLLAAALCSQATLVCVSGSARDGERAAALLERAESLCEGDALGLARVYSARAVCAFLLAQHSATITHADEAERRYRELVSADGEMAGEYYHRFAVAAVRIGARFQLGQNVRAIAELRSEQAEARATENHTATLHLTLVATIADIIESHPERSVERLVKERLQLPPHSFGPLHLLHLVAVMWAGCASRNHAWALEICAQDWPRFERSVVRRSAYLSLLAHSWHARLLIHQCVVESRRQDAAGLVRLDQRALAKLPANVAGPALLFLRARLSYLNRDRASALELFRATEALCKSKGMLAEAAGLRLVLGVMIEGKEGRQLLEEGERTMRALGMAEPMTLMEYHLPEVFSPA